MATSAAGTARKFLSKGVITAEAVGPTAAAAAAQAVAVALEPRGAAGLPAAPRKHPLHPTNQLRYRHAMNSRTGGGWFVVVALSGRVFMNEARGWGSFTKDDTLSSHQPTQVPSH